MPDLQITNMSAVKQGQERVFNIKNGAKSKKKSKRISADRSEMYESLPFIQYKNLN